MMTSACNLGAPFTESYQIIMIYVRICVCVCVQAVKILLHGQVLCEYMCVVALKRGQCGVMERVVGTGALAAAKDGMCTATATMMCVFLTQKRPYPVYIFIGKTYYMWSRSEFSAYSPLGGPNKTAIAGTHCIITTYL